MMIRDIGRIKELRTTLGLTQGELADKAKVSQSLIAKVENGTLMPSYEKGRKILDVLEDRLSKSTNTSGIQDICSRDIISVEPDDTVEKALKLMRKNAVSQLPVIEEGDIRGSITERCLLHRYDDIDRDQKISSVMDESFPVVDTCSNIDLVKDVLKYYPSVMVSEKGDLIGIVTKADLLKNL